MAKARVLESNSGAFNKNMHRIVLVQDSATTRELSVDMSGSLVILRATGGATKVNLPDALNNAGVYYEFMVNENTDAEIAVQSKDGTDFFLGFVSDAEVDETIQFLRWLGADHFTFLGFREYRFNDNPATFDFTHVDGDYYRDLLSGVVAHAGALDDVMRGKLDRSIEELDPVEHSLLRMGVYELRDRIDVPYKVVLNEAVALAKKFGATESFRYVNGVLDKVAHELRKLEINAEV